MVQERELLQQTLDVLMASLEKILHPSAIERILRDIGADLGRQVCHQYRLTRGTDLPLSRKEYGPCLQGLEEMGWPCRLVEETADRSRFLIACCPFGKGAARTTSFCGITSGLFGGTASDQFGYAKVRIQRGMGTPPRGCSVTVYVRRTEESEAGAGTVYEKRRAADSAEPPSETVPLQRLSQRECEVLRLIGDGMTDKDIAETLHLSARTVENHGTRIRAKLGISSRAGLIRFAVRLGS